MGQSIKYDVSIKKTERKIVLEHDCVRAKSLSPVRLCDPMDCSLPGSSVRGIFWARILEWVAMLSSRGSSQPRNWTQVFSIASRFFTTEPPGKSTDTSVQFSSVSQPCPTLCDLMNRSTPGLPVHHQLPEFTQTHVHRVSDAIQPSHPLSSPSPLALNPSQHQSQSQLWGIVKVIYSKIT